MPLLAYFVTRSNFGHRHSRICGLEGMLKMTAFGRSATVGRGHRLVGWGLLPDGR